MNEGTLVETRARSFGLWSGVLFFVLWAIAFALIARWVPPLSPALTAGEIAQMFQERSVSIRLAMILMSVSSVLYLPWTMLLSDLIRKMEGGSFVLSGTQLAAGIVGQLTFFLPSYFWANAAFRAGRGSDEITQALVDQGFLLFMTPISPFILQYMVLAVAIFLYRGDKPLFPRWIAYMQVWVSASFLPAMLAFFLKEGPFAWDGLFVWWIPALLFTTWFALMVFHVRAAVVRLARQGSAA